MAFAGDPWISDIVYAKRLHALGVATARWNACEGLLATIFGQVFGLDPDVARILTHDMPTPTMCDKIEALVGHKPIDPETDEALLHAVRLFTVNRINRNQLTHFSPGLDSNGDPAFYRSKGAFPKSEEIPSKVDDIRRVADDLLVCIQYLIDLHMRFKFSKHAQFRTLPERPPLPKRLWEPPPANPPRSPRQRKSSKA